MAEIEGGEAVTPPKATAVPIHSAPKTSPRKHRRTKPSGGPNVTPETPPKDAVAGLPPDEPAKRRGHALDFAPVHSKIVKTDRGAVIVEPPIGPKLLPAGDSAHGLPVGAKIEKLTAETYRSTQLDAQFDAPPTTHTTAIDAIAAFAAHFWPDGA